MGAASDRPVPQLDPDVVDLNERRRNGSHDIEWLLNAAGPSFGDVPGNAEIFGRLELFGQLFHRVESAAEQETARQTWLAWFDKYAAGIAEPTRVLQRAIDAGKAHAGVAREPFRWYTVEDLAQLTAPAPLLGDMIAAESFGMMYGAQGATKTFHALGMSLSIATGHSWHGVDVTQGPVAYILGEGRGGINARVEAWRNAHGIPDGTPFRLLPQPVDFLEPTQVSALLASLEAWDVPPKLVVIDTLYRCFGGSENDTGDMAAFIAGVGRLQRETGSAVLALHHPGHDATRGRGHSALPQAVDTIIRVERDKDSGLVTLSCDKQRDGVPFAKRQFRLCLQPPSMVVELAELQLPASAEAALAALNKIAAWDGATYTDWRKATKQGNSTFNRNLERLIQGDCVEKSADDTYQITAEGSEILGLDRESYSHPPSGSNSAKKEWE